MYINGVLETINGEVIGNVNDIYLYFKNKMIDIENNTKDTKGLESKLNRIIRLLKKLDNLPIEIIESNYIIVGCNDENEFYCNLLVEQSINNN